MFFSKWTLFQGGVLACMVFLVILAEWFSTQITNVMSSGPFGSFLLVMTFILLASSLISLFLIFHSKKSERFLSHPLWEKMNILLAFLFILSIITFISVAFFTSLNDAMSANRWILYIFVYYFLFLFNLFVLSLVHKIKKNASKEKKIELSFVWTFLSLAVLIYLFPSF